MSEPPAGEETGAPGDGETVTTTVEDLMADLTGLTAGEPDPETQAEVQDVKEVISEAHGRGLITSGVRDLRVRDVAEAFVGSVIFASPLLVEDGIFDIADHLVGFTIASIPVFLIANTVFVVAMTYALVEWTGRDKDETQLLFGTFPVRVVMVLGVSLIVATILMTVWGRVGNWRTPAEALARINVIWTVGSLGAALGDILSESDASPTTVHRSDSPDRLAVGDDESTSGPVDDADQLSDTELIDAINEQFDELESAVDTPAERREVQRLREETIQATLDDMFGDKIHKYTSRDVAEAFVGSIFFAIPFLVEDGVFDVAVYFLSFQVGYFPIFFLANAVFVILMIMAVVYWAGPQDVRVSRPVLGFIPRRLIGIAVVSFLTAASLMTMWGRVGTWQDPLVALARISVVWTVASFGAALGDILPGESSGADINEDLAALGELAGGDGDPEDEAAR